MLQRVSFTVYWPGWQCEEVHEAGLTGRPLTVFTGGWNQQSDFLRYRFQRGDSLVVITIAGGVLYVVGRMTVRFKGFRRDWIAQNAAASVVLSRMTSGQQVVVGSDGTPIRFDCAVPPALLPDWRFVSPDGKRPRSPKYIGEDFRIKKANSFTGVFRLAPETDAMIDDVLEGRISDPEFNDRVAHIQQLEQRMLDEPTDEELACVLADALIEMQDPRGDMLLVEVELARRPDNRVLKRRRNKLLKEHAVRLLGRPGGFPYRSGWTPHQRV